MSDPDLRYGSELKRRVQANLETFARRSYRQPGLTPAAVAVTIVPAEDGNEDSCFILTRRTKRLQSHSGQWALPGGKLDPGETSEEAALRELSEEVGVEVGRERILGLLDDFPSRSGYVITPVVVWGARDTKIVPNPAEVRAVYRVPIRKLEGSDLPKLRDIPESRSPVISFPLEGSDVHAPTAAILYQLREVAVHGRNTRVAHYEQPIFAWT